MSQSSLRASQLEPTHRELLESWRHAMNLVGPGPIDPHFDDAHRALKGLTLTGRWADLGTGAGFPGLVWAAALPELELELVDSRRKRCTFLEEVLQRAGVTDVTVTCARVETLAPASYDGITGRAFTQPEALLAHARRLLRPDGQVVLFLQGDTPPPQVEDFELLHEHAYTAGGRPRRVAWLQRR